MDRNGCSIGTHILSYKPKSQHYNAKLLKGVPDGQNPLGPVNRMRYFMQCFLRAHPGSNRDDMRGCGYESARGQA